MTKEEKELLLKDLCARLPYGVKGKTLGSQTCTLHYIGKDGSITADAYYCWIENKQFIPYLRPMSSMTEEEREHLQTLHDIISDENYEDGFSPAAWNAILLFNNYCHKHHLDNAGLIKKGLALEASNDIY